MQALQLIESWPVDNASAGWVTASGTTGRSNASGALFALASLTKPLFALAVLVAVEEGTLALDHVITEAGATVADVLAHASGLAPDQPEQLEPPRRRRIYSNAGFELLGAALEKASGFSSAEYLNEAVCVPLGLGSTQLDGSPAHGATSCVDDLLTFAAELLSPTLISPQTLILATQPHLPHLSGVLPGYRTQRPNPWGLGFEIRGLKAPHWTGSTNSPNTFGHFGRSGTMLWVDPMANLACVALTDREFGPWAREVWPPFSDAIRAENAEMTSRLQD